MTRIDRYSREEQCPDCRGEQDKGYGRLSFCVCSPKGHCPRCKKILAGGKKQTFEDVLFLHTCPKKI